MVKLIDNDVATKVVEEVNAAIGETPAFNGWNLYVDRNAQGVTGFGASHNGGGAIPDPLMQVINDTLQANNIAGASFKVRS